VTEAWHTSVVARLWHTSVSSVVAHLLKGSWLGRGSVGARSWHTVVVAHLGRARSWHTSVVLGRGTPRPWHTSVVAHLLKWSGLGHGTPPEGVVARSWHTS